MVAMYTGGDVHLTLAVHDVRLPALRHPVRGLPGTISIRRSNRLRHSAGLTKSPRFMRRTAGSGGRAPLPMLACCYQEGLTLDLERHNAVRDQSTLSRNLSISCQQCRIVGSSRLAVKKRVRLHSSALRLRPPEGAAAIRRCLAESRSWFPENAVIG
jgi:hypothetical protein